MAEAVIWLPVLVEVVVACWGWRSGRRGSSSGPWCLLAAGYMAASQLALTGMLLVLAGPSELLAIGGALACIPVVMLPTLVQWSRRRRAGWIARVLGIVLLATAWIGGYIMFIFHSGLTYPIWSQLD